MYQILNRGWEFWICISLIILFILWLFYGGEDHEYVGLKPLKTGVDSTKYVDDYPEEYIGESTEESYSSGYSSGYSTDEDVKVEDVKDEWFKDDIIKPCIINLIKPPIKLFDKPKFSKEECAKALGKYKEYKSGKRSKFEQTCNDILEDIYNKPFYTIRPDFLKNPETKRNLEIDCYNDELHLGLESQGPSHYWFPNGLTRTKEDFMKQIRRDQFKIEQCDANGVYLITVPCTVKKEDYRDFIIYNLPENARQRERDEENRRKEEHDKKNLQGLK